MMLFVFLAGVLCAAAEAPNPTVLKPQPEDSESYTESFMMMADLADGGYAQFHLMVSNVGFGDQSGACRALLVNKQGAAWTASIDADDDWQFVAGRAPSLRVGSCRMTAGETTVVSASLDGRKLTLTLMSPTRLTAPPGSLVEAKGGFYQGDILVPWARAELRLRDKDKPEHRVLGTGYVDHFRSTAMPADLARKYVRFRITDPDCALLFFSRLPVDVAAAPVGWLWPRDKTTPTRLDGTLRIDIHGSANDGELPSVSVASAAGAMRFAARKLLYRHAPMEEHGLLGRLVGSWVGSPVTRTYRAQLEPRRRGACGSATGILEITEVRGK